MDNIKLYRIKDQQDVFVIYNADEEPGIHCSIGKVWKTHDKWKCIYNWTTGHAHSNMNTAIKDAMKKHQYMLAI